MGKIAWFTLHVIFAIILMYPFNRAISSVGRADAS